MLVSDVARLVNRMNGPCISGYIHSGARDFSRKRYFGTGLAIVGLGLMGSTSAPAQDTSAAASDPLSGMGVQIVYSYKIDYLLHTTTPYYDISYKNKDLFKGGTQTNPADFGLGDDPIAFGDAPLSISIDNGLGTIGGTTVSSLGVMPLSWRVGKLEGFRLIAGVDGQTQGGTQSAAFGGIEWKPFDSYSATTEHFLGLSARYGSQASSAATSQSIGSLAARGRLGVGFDLKVSTQRTSQIAQELVAALQSHRDVANALAQLSQSGIAHGLFAKTFSSGPIAKENLDLEFDAYQNGLSKAFLRKRHVDITKISNSLGRIANDRLDKVTIAPQAEFESKKADFEKSQLNLTALMSQSDRSKLDALAPEAAVQLTTNLASAKRTQEAASKALATAQEKLAPFVRAKTELASTQFTSYKAAAILAFATSDEIAAAVGAKTPGTTVAAGANNPRFAFYTEFDTSYYGTAPVSGPRARLVYSLNLKFSFNASDQNSPYILVTYENGETRAAPDTKLNCLLVTGTFKF